MNIDYAEKGEKDFSWAAKRSLGLPMKGYIKCSYSEIYVVNSKGVFQRIWSFNADKQDVWKYPIINDYP